MPRQATWRRYKKAAMGILVKYTKTHPSGRVEYRRAFPGDLLPLIGGKADPRWAEHKVSLGHDCDRLWASQTVTAAI